MRTIRKINQNEIEITETITEIGINKIYKNELIEKKNELIKKIAEIDKLLLEF